MLALATTTEVARFVADLERGHSQHLLPAIEALRVETGLGSAPLAGVGVVVGPGSFTGVRIAVAAAQALAFAYACPVARLDALQVLAESALIATPATAPSSSGVFCCARRSRADLYYLGAYRHEDGNCRRLGELELVGSRAELDAWWRACGQAAEAAQWSLPATAAAVDWLGDSPPWADVVARSVEPSPDALLRVAEHAFASGEVVSAADALPLYLSADSPWRPRAR